MRLTVSHLRTALICTCVCLPWLANAFDLGELVKNPALEQALRDKTQGDPSDADEEKIGREIAGRLLGAAPLIPNDALQQYVNTVGRYVASQSPRANMQWTFGVIESNTINAFATPGGYVFITRGLYALLTSEAELAGVLAHEIGHINARHHLKVLQQQRLVSAGQELFSNATTDSTTKKLLGNGAEILARGLDKDAELEADRLGVYYATKAGYDTYGLVAVLERLDTTGNPDALSMLYKTHPLPSERLTALDTAIAHRYDTQSPGLTLPKRLVKLPPKK